MGLEWITTPEEAFTGLYDGYVQAIYGVAMAICYRRAPEIENWMKENAQWEDQTGNARQTLWTDVVTMGFDIVVLAGHGMPYGKWLELKGGKITSASASHEGDAISLELKRAGKYAIITPAIDHWAPILMADIQAAIQ